MKLAWPESQNRVLLKCGSIDSVLVDASAFSGSRGGGKFGSLCCAATGASVTPNRTQTSRTQREHSARRQTAILFVFLIAADLTQNFLRAGIDPLQCTTARMQQLLTLRCLH